MNYLVQELKLVYLKAYISGLYLWAMQEILKYICEACLKEVVGKMWMCLKLFTLKISRVEIEIQTI